MSKFSFNTTVSLVKGEGDSKGKMLMKGIASTSSKDTDGHTLQPKGFDTSYFLKKGFMNWNHEWKKNPLSIIGRPSKAFVNKENELEIQYELFKGHKTAEEVYSLAEILEANGTSLGLSIEGEVVERDPKNPNNITKARITDCAITPHPKNAGTITNIIKGNDFKELVDFDGLGAFEVGADGELLVKSTTTDVVDDIMPESVEGMSSKKKKKKEGEEGVKTLTKSQVFDLLKEKRPNITLQHAEAIFDYTVNFQKSIQMSKVDQGAPEVTDEAFNGALEKLGLSKGQETETVDASAPAGDEASAGPAAEAPPAPETPAPAATQEIEKGMSAEEDMEKGKKKAYKDMSAEEKAAHKESLSKALEAAEAEDALEKGTVTDPLAPELGEGSELIKAITATIEKGNVATEKLINEKTKALGVLNQEQGKLIKGLSERLEKLEGTPNKPRAVLTKAFEPKPGEQLEKGGQPEGEVYSLSEQKGALCTRLTDAAIEKAQGVENIDARLKADIIGLEAGNHLAPSVMEFAKSLNITIIQ